MTYHAIGLMSGSSLDGLDVALCRFETDEVEVGFSIKNWEVFAAETCPLSDFWKRRILRLPAGNAFELADAHAAFGAYLGSQVSKFILEKGIDCANVNFVASHGHTIFHEPAEGFTFQLGDGASLAVESGCQVVSDFRTADVTLGGQGAPLAPVADRMLFPGFDFYLNLGGIANLTCNANGKWVAFDVTGANQELNALSKKFADRPFDDDGALARQGNLNEEFLAQLNDQPFFEQPYPKSLSNQWVQENLVKISLASQMPVEDLLHTTCHHIALQLKNSISQVVENESFAKANYRLLATGGGAFNGFLMDCIREELPQVEVIIPAKKIVEFKEAALMALLGVMRLEGVPNCMASVTGASRDAIGGAVYLPA